MSDYNHIVYYSFDLKVHCDSEEGAIENILDSGYDIKKTKIEEKDGKIYYYPKGKPEDWKIIKNFAQKLKELPGFAEEHYKKLEEENSYEYKPPLPEQTSNQDPFDGEWYSSNAYNSSNAYKNNKTNEKIHPDWPDNKPPWYNDYLDEEPHKDEIKDGIWNPFKKHVQEQQKIASKKNVTSKKGKKHTKIPYKIDPRKYAIYNKGKLEKKKIFGSLKDVSNYVTSKDAVIINIDDNSDRNQINVFILQLEEISHLLPDSHIIERFEEIAYKIARENDFKDNDNYEDLEV